jgi:hypothetical protein
MAACGELIIRRTRTHSTKEILVTHATTRGRHRTGRTRGFLAVAAALSAALVGVPSNDARAQARGPLGLERSILLDALVIETIRIESRLQAWTLRKVCIDGQAYWIGFSDTTPTAISPAFKDGRPEQCPQRAR